MTGQVPGPCRRISCADSSSTATYPPSRALERQAAQRVSPTWPCGAPCSNWGPAGLPPAAARVFSLLAALAAPHPAHLLLMGLPSIKSWHTSTSLPCTGAGTGHSPPAARARSLRGVRWWRGDCRRSLGSAPPSAGTCSGCCGHAASTHGPHAHAEEGPRRDDGAPALSEDGGSHERAQLPLQLLVGTCI